MISKFDFIRDFHLDQALAEPTEELRREALYNLMVEYAGGEGNSLVSDLRNELEEKNDIIRQIQSLV